MQLSKMTDLSTPLIAATAGSSNFTTAECINCADHQGAYFLLGCGSTYAAAITLSIYGSDSTASTAKGLLVTHAPRCSMVVRPK